LTWRWEMEGNISFTNTIPVSSTWYAAQVTPTSAERLDSLRRFGELLREHDGLQDVSSAKFYKEIRTRSGVTYRSDPCYRKSSRYDIVRLLNKKELGQLLTIFECKEGYFVAVRMLEQLPNHSNEYFPWPLYKLARKGIHQDVRILSVDDIDFKGAKPFMAPDFSSIRTRVTYFDYQWWT
jgi:hypothetical protein